jgi:hypothetical protein
MMFVKLDNQQALNGCSQCSNYILAYSSIYTCFLGYTLLYASRKKICISSVKPSFLSNLCNNQSIRSICQRRENVPQGLSRYKYKSRAESTQYSHVDSYKTCHANKNYQPYIHPQRKSDQTGGKAKKGCRTYWRYRESNTGWRGSGSEHWVFASHNATSYH